MKIVKIYSLEQWTGVEDVQGYVRLPKGMDLRIEEGLWFSKGGDCYMPFLEYLLTRGAKKVEISDHCISYM